MAPTEERKLQRQAVITPTTIFQLKFYFSGQDPPANKFRGAGS